MSLYGYYPRICGCYYTETVNDRLQRTFLPQVKLSTHTTILSTASRTVLEQTFVNPSKKKPLDELRYAFPLFDGISVVSFKCQIKERTIFGLVKEKREARKMYNEAKERGEAAALFEQLPDMADVFTTSVSNIPEGASVDITITYIQELKHDAEVDGVRLTIPTHIAPRYGTYPSNSIDTSAVDDSGGISITVDVSMADAVPIKKIISPSHPVEVSLGTLSTSAIDEDPSVSKASATLALGTAQLEKDFVLQVVAKDVGIPQVILETHPSLPNQRALMTTLVPKFKLKSQKPEIIFIADRSGSMSGNIPTLISALQVFLKSIPVGCMFNICSFGSHHEFLWPKSRLYSRDALGDAIQYVKTFGSDFGGTETLSAVKAAVDGRLTGMATEIMLLTDGDISSQQQMFEYIEKETKSGDVRIFPIGIGGGVSSALIEGVARAGRGFAQMVGNNEKLEGKIVRMLKGALTPHIKDYHLEVKYEDDSVDSVAESLRLKLNFAEVDDGKKETEGRYPLRDMPISLYDPDVKEEQLKTDESNDVLASLPKFDRPKVLQTPHEIPALFPFNRTCVYLLMSPEACDLQPKSVVLKGTSPEGPLELEIPVQIRGEPDEMVHQLAARKATQELEEGRGWIVDARTDADVLVKEKYPAQFELLEKREAVRLGVEFQVGGKYCSFVAVEANNAEIEEKRRKALEKFSKAGSTEKDGDGEDWEVVEQELAVEASTETKRKRSAGRAKQTVCMSSGGKAPRKQLASKASRKSAPSAPVQTANAPSGRGGLGRGGAMRHRKILRADNEPGKNMFLMYDADDLEIEEEDAAESDNEDLGFGLFDGDSDPEVVASATISTVHGCIESERLKTPRLAEYTTKKKGKKGKQAMKSDADDLDLEIEEEDAEESDNENLGFLLFDGDSDPEVESERLKTPRLAEYTTKKKGKQAMKSDIDKSTLLQLLIKRQTFEGSWSNDDLPCDAMGILRHAASVVIEKLVVAHPELEREKIGAALATAITIKFLIDKMPEEEDTWELVVEKAREWLDEGVEGNVLKVIWSEAEKLVGGIAA